MLEPIRQFAEGLLAEAGELDGARLRHAEWTAAFWREAYDVFQHDAAQRYYDLLHAHGAEAIAVAEWAMDTGRPDIAVSIVASVGRKWSGLLDSAPLAAVALRALDHPDVTRGAEYVRALANATWSYRVLDRDLALRLLERLEAVAPAVTDVEAKAAATEMLAIVPQVVENLGLDEDLVTESLRRFDEFLGYLGELGRPQGPHLYNRIIFLHEVGRFGEAKQEFERIRDWALGADPKEWIGVVHHEGTLAAIAGRFAEAAESLAEASRLGSETDDPVSVMESERDLIGVLARAGRSEEALEAMARYNENAALVGWPPVEEFNPDVVAPVFANLGRWDAFETVLRRWVEASVPLRANERSWQAFLEGRYVVPSRVVHLLVPVAEWLLATGRESEAATLLASAPMAFESTKFPFWEAIGEVARAEQLRKGVGVAEGLGSLEEVFGVVAELVR